MLDAIKPLLESGLINESVGQAINEAWESKLNEAREEVRAELREEFSRRHEQDKQHMATALEKMVTEGLRSEIEEFTEERAAMNKDRVAAKQKLRESAGQFNDFMVKKLAEEIKELREERRNYHGMQSKLHEFVLRSLAKEINEFAQDKQELTEARVRLVRESRSMLAQTKKKFVKEAAERLSSLVTTKLDSELTQLKEDISAAKKNTFGRKLFEAYMSEFSASYLNENAMARQLKAKLQATQTALAESKANEKKAKTLLESKTQEAKKLTEAHERQKIMSSLLMHLTESKAREMKELLEGVQTAKLKSTFDKYLPAVLNGSGKQASNKMLTEGKVVTGNKSNTAEDGAQIGPDVHEMKRLAGLK